MQLLIAYDELLGNIGCDLVQSYHLRPSSKRVWYCSDWRADLPSFILELCHTLNLYIPCTKNKNGLCW